MIMIGFTGDIALSGIISDFSEERIRDQLSLRKIADDAAFVINLESPAAYAGAQSNKEKGVRLRCSSDALTSFLKNNCIAAVTLANNHSLDYGAEGIRETIRILDSFKIPHTGAGTKPEHSEPAYFYSDDISYALLGYVHPATNPFCEKSLYLNIYQKEEILAEIKKAKSYVEKVILTIHWGKDYSAFPQKWQMEDAHEFINEGTDIIIGHHPHVIQPFENFKGKYIFYSLGSTIFGDFYLHDRLRALPVKTKRSFIPLFRDLETISEFAGVKELNGNRLTPESRNIAIWSKKMMRRSNNKNKYKVCNFLLDVKEGYTDRVYDLLFGYYRNPVKDVFSASAIRNGLRIIKKKG